MNIKICVDDDCITYLVDDMHKDKALRVMQLIRAGKFKTAGLMIYSLLKDSKLV